MGETWFLMLLEVVNRIFNAFKKSKIEVNDLFPPEYHESTLEQPQIY